MSDELAALVRAARREPGPEAPVRARIWSAIEQRLAFGPPAPSIVEPSTAATEPPHNLVLLRAR